MKKIGYDLLRDPFMNKGTAFTLEERKENGLTGLLPPAVETIDQQADRVYAQYKSEHPGIEKRRYLMEIFNDNRTLFFHAFRKHVAEWMPVVYDPVIAESIETYSDKYVKPQYAAFLSIDHPEEIEETLKKAAEGRKIKLIVVTDAEAILGIGDWGVNGVDISIGKLMVYTAAAGLDPSTVLPVVLDCGTDRKELLDDPMYLGNSHPRVRNASYDAFVDRFVKAVENEFPGVYLHFEDFGREHAAEILEKYINDYPVFNDDRQGTGIITLAGLIGAMHISGKNLTDQVYMCFGAGTAGCGIVTRIWREMMDEGLSEEEARSRFYMVDKQGLLFDDMDDLTPEQKPFARKRSEFEHPEALTTLEAAVEAIHPTILVSASEACDRAKMACDVDRHSYMSFYNIFDKNLLEKERTRSFVLLNIGDALKNHEIEVYYQPQVDARTGKLCGAEGLARWNSPKAGFMMPGKFIPVLEAANLTYKLDIYIIRQIARDFRKCIEEGTPIVPVSFNFSRTDFETCNPYEELQKAVKEYNLEPKMFRVEITESTLMSDPAKIKEQMTLFRKAGYEVLMDDFGSAYSSLATLRDFDFDEIKIDMGFMRNFSDKSKKIIRPMIMLAQSLDVHTLTEGVETAEQLSFLQQAGCERIQGYYFSKPIPYSEFVQKLKTMDCCDDLKDCEK